MKTRVNIARFIFFTSFLLSSHAYAQRELEQIDLHNGILEIQLSDAKLSITPINSGTVEVLYQALSNDNTPNKQLPSFALPKNHSIYMQGKLTQNASGYKFVLANLHVHIHTKPFSLSYSNESGLLASEEVGLFNYPSLRGFRFHLADNEKIMGGGQRVLGMDRRGQRMPLYNKAHYGYNGKSSQMYFGLSAIMSNKQYIIAFDNSASGQLDIGYTQTDILQFEAEAGRTAYIFSAGNTYYQLIENFVSATGKQPLPPRWALGNYASRFGYKSQQEVLDVVNEFKQQDFPLDAIVLDLYWFGADIKGHMGNLSWDRVNWPSPEKMISTLKEGGVNTIMITEPFILSSSSQWQSALDNHALAKDLAGNPKTFEFYFGNTGLVDVFNTPAQDWFWQYYQKLNEQGVAGWWGDLGEPEVHPADTIHQFGEIKVSANEIHNAYGHKWAEMVYERQQKAKPNQRPFIMMRSGFIGSQRYGMIPWTGDVDRSWGGLQPQVELALQMSMFGLAYIHSDLGGFAGGETFDSELYIRWLQYGAFQPVYRPHAQDHIAPEPVFHDAKTQGIVREYVKLRYRLLPYNYSLSMQNSLFGHPMMRPLFMDFTKQELSRTDAYMWGDAFLVAPVIKPGQAMQTLSLPQGLWYDYWQNRPYKGAQTHEIETPLHKLPVFVRAGTFVPSVIDMPNTADYSTENLRVDYYLNDQSSETTYTMYDDNGIDPNSIQTKQYQSISFSSKQNNPNSVQIDAKLIGHFKEAPRLRNIKMVVNGLLQKPTLVRVDGKTIKLTEQPITNKDYAQAYYNRATHQLSVYGRLVKHLQITIK